METEPTRLITHITVLRTAFQTHHKVCWTDAEGIKREPCERSSKGEKARSTTQAAPTFSDTTETSIVVLFILSISNFYNFVAQYFAFFLAPALLRFLIVLHFFLHLLFHFVATCLLYWLLNDTLKCETFNSCSTLDIIRYVLCRRLFCFSVSLTFYSTPPFHSIIIIFSAHRIWPHLRFHECDLINWCTLILLTKKPATMCYFVCDCRRLVQALVF